MPRFFSGPAGDLGVVSCLPEGDFPSLLELISRPQSLPLTRTQYETLDAKAKQVAKRVQYLTPTAFKEDQSRRKNEFATACNLIALDIDDAAEAKQVMTEGFGALREFGHVVWHTASSTELSPRLRVLVYADEIPLDKYTGAVKTVADLLGLHSVTHESLVPVQPMFLPTSFAGEEDSPIIVSQDGDAFQVSDIIAESESSTTPQRLVSQGDVADLEYFRQPMEGVTLTDAEEAMSVISPDCPMQQWIEVAAGLKHQFGEAGYELWDTWSAKGEKYISNSETAYRWSTLVAQPTDRAPVTIRSLFKLATIRGWSNPALGHRIHEQTLSWLQNSARTTEELLDQGIKRIAKAAPAISPLERKVLMISLRDALAGRNMALPLPDIKREVGKIELEAAKTTGVPPWAKGLCFVTAINTFYRHTTDRRFKPEVIDLMYSTPKMGEDTQMSPKNYLIQIVGIPQVENLRYAPAIDKRFITEESIPYVNTYRKGGAGPDARDWQSAADIFQKHIANLIAEPEYQRLLIDFLAYHVQHPGQKIRWATLLQSTQGAGKTFIAAAMKAMLGRRNVRKLSAKNVLSGVQNDWAYGSQLAIMEEIRIVGTNRHAIMDELKPLISDDDISLRCMFEAPRTVPNITNYLMFTNYHDALAINDSDRRYFVLASPLQRPDHLARLGGAEYFNRLFGMLRTNAGGLRHFFEKWTFSPDFNPEGRAPFTPYLRVLADNAASPLAATVNEAISDSAHPLVQPDLLSMMTLREIMDVRNIPDFSDQALAGVLREYGWLKECRCMINGSKHQLWSRNLQGDAKQMATARDTLV